jgi:hypothetical protein
MQQYPAMATTGVRSVQWLPSLEEACAQAGTTGKLVLLDFFKPT